MTMYTKKILIIGAGFLQRFVIRRARELGYYTLAVDANEKAIGFIDADDYAVIDITNEKECLEYAVKNKINGVLTAATDYGVLTASYIAEKMCLPGLNYKSAQLIKNKYRVRRCFFKNHVDDTEQAYEINKDTNIESLKGYLTYPVIVKPCDGSGSRGTSRVDEVSQLDSACKFAVENSITHRAEIESFINGCEYGAESLVVNGEIHVLGIMRKWMTDPPYYAELGHAIPSGLSSFEEKKIKLCVEKGIKALGVNFGSVNMDLLLTKNGTVHIIDVGARMGGNLIGSHIIPLGTGIQYMDNMLKIAVNDIPDFKPQKSFAVATRLLALVPGIVKKLPDFNKISKDNDVIIEHHLSVGDKICEYHTNLDGCGYVVVCSDDVEKASAKAERLRRMIDNCIERQEIV